MELNVLCFNLRINVSSDNHNAWDFRKENVFRFLNDQQYDIMGFQEPNHMMYQELKDHLKGYDSFGSPRNQGGEYTPVFMKKGLYEVVESETFWLTDTPYIESKIEGSHYIRIATYVVLKLRSNRYLTIINTHLDYANEHIIFNQIEYLYKMMKVLEIKYHTEFIVMGDFNSHPNSIGIEFLSTKLNQVFNHTKNFSLTFHAFSDQEEGLPIDYMFYSSQIKLTHFEILHHEKKGNYLSDHYPLYAIFHIED